VLVEGAQTSLLDTPETLRAVLDEAGPDGLGANLDPVNYLTPRQVARFGAAVEEMVEALGPRLAAVHVKDAVVRPELSVHVDEVPAGQGVLDLSPVVEAAARAGVPALVEHLDDAEADAAMRTLAALAANLARAA
jgi:sugar phosphate isomerase/epimerase